MSLIDLSDAGLIAPARVPQDVPPEVLAAARGVFELAGAVNRREGNPFADLANQDGADLAALHKRVQAQFRAICTVHSGGMGVAP